ncbi:PDR/VanB family oxidoreductase [Microbacterium sp. KNMS]
MAIDSIVTWGISEVLESELVSDRVRRIVLAPQEPVHARPGTHVDVRLRPDLDGTAKTLTRSYSIVRSEDDGRRLTLAVQLAARSRGGSRRMHALRPGDRIPTTAPLQNFPLGVGAARYVLLAGGIGLTATIAMAETLRVRGSDYRLIVIGRTREALPFLDELAERHGDRLELRLTGAVGRPDLARLAEDVAAHPLAARTEMYLCGPVPLMEDMKRAWLGAGLALPSLRFETFGNSGSWEPQDFVVRLPQLGRKIGVPADATVLETLEDAGIAVMSDCRKGECGLCAVRILEVSGRVDHRDVFFDDAQKAADDRLCLCVSRAAFPPSPQAPAGRGVLTLELP